MRVKSILPVALLLASGASAARSAPVETIPAPAAEKGVAAVPVAMTLNLTPGQVRAYKVTVNQNSVMTTLGASAGIPIKMDISADAKLFVDRANPDGSYAVRFRVGGAKVELSVSGQPFNMPKPPDSAEIAGTIGKNGKFVPAVKPKAGADITGMGVDPNQLVSGLLSNLTSIPDPPVAVGETWTTRVAVPLDASGASIVQVNNKMLGVDSGAGGERVARIEQNYSGPLTLALAQPLPATVKGTVTGSGMSKVSVSTGQTLSTGNTLRLLGDVEIGGGSGMKMKMDSTLVWKMESSLLPASPVAEAVATVAAKP